jgi:hypothetical protein
MKLTGFPFQIFGWRLLAGSIWPHANCDSAQIRKMLSRLSISCLNRNETEVGPELAGEHSYC